MPAGSGKTIVSHSVHISPPHHRGKKASKKNIILFSKMKSTKQVLPEVLFEEQEDYDSETDMLLTESALPATVS